MEDPKDDPAPNPSEVLEKKILEVLASLGSTAEEVAFKLRQANCKGIRLDAGSCPIANFVKERFDELHYFSVCLRNFAFLAKERGAILQEFEPKDFPKGASAFISDFDQCKYPNLIETKE